MLAQKLLYEQGNKSGRLLAGMLRHKQAASHIHNLRDDQGHVIWMSNTIARHFFSFFNRLYNLLLPPTREFTAPQKGNSGLFGRVRPQATDYCSGNSLEAPCRLTNYNRL